MDNEDQFITFQNQEEYARISGEGKLLKFNNDLCRSAAKEFDIIRNNDINGIVQDYQAWAKLITLILDGAAEEVSHIMKKVGGNQGDLIRGFNVK